MGQLAAAASNETQKRARTYGICMGTWINEKGTYQANDYIVSILLFQTGLHLGEGNQSPKAMGRT